MTTTTITEDLDLPDGTAPRSIQVHYELAGEGGDTIEGFVDDGTRLGRVRARPNSTGWYSIDLPGNDDIVPAGTRWKRTVTFPGGVLEDVVDYLDVPTDGATYRLDEVLDEAPASIASPALGVEIAARIAADLVLQGDIDAETAARIAALVAHVAASDPHGDRAYTDAQITALKAGVGTAYDTLLEIAAQLASDESAVAALTAVVAGKQPLHANLTALAALGGQTAFGRALLTLADQPALLAAAGAQQAGTSVLLDGSATMTGTLKLGGSPHFFEGLYSGSPIAWMATENSMLYASPGLQSNHQAGVGALYLKDTVNNRELELSFQQFGACLAAEVGAAASFAPFEFWISTGVLSVRGNYKNNVATLLSHQIHIRQPSDADGWIFEAGRRSKDVSREVGGWARSMAGPMNLQLSDGTTFRLHGAGKAYLGGQQAQLDGLVADVSLHLYAPDVTHGVEVVFGDYDSGSGQHRLKWKFSKLESSGAGGRDLLGIENWFGGSLLANRSMYFTRDGAVMFFGKTNVPSGEGVIKINNATTVPTADPTGGGILYSEGGALKWRGTAGTITTVAAA